MSRKLRKNLKEDPPQGHTRHYITTERTRNVKLNYKDLNLETKTYISKMKKNPERLATEEKKLIYTSQKKCKPTEKYPVDK